MSKDLFKGTLNGTEYTDKNEFLKAFKEMNPEDVKSYSYSFESTNENNNDVKTDVTVKENQQVFDLFAPESVIDYINKLFENFAAQYGFKQSLPTGKPVEEAPAKKEKTDNARMKLPWLDLDAFTGDSEHDEKILDDVSEKLFELQKEFEKLAKEDQKVVLNKFDNAFNVLADKHKATLNKMDEIDAWRDKILDEIAELEEKTSKLHDKLNTLDAKYDVLANVDDALTLYKDFNNLLIETIEKK